VIGKINQTAPDFFFLWSQLHLEKLHPGKLHKERAMIGRIFQAQPTQIDTTVALIYKITPKLSSKGSRNS
jgi:hypothetical protein